MARKEEGMGESVPKGDKVSACLAGFLGADCQKRNHASSRVGKKKNRVDIGRVDYMVHLHYLPNLSSWQDGLIVK